MDRLKKILRQALQDQSQRINLKQGQPVELLTAAGPTVMANEGPIDYEYLQKLFGFLFPQDKAAIAAKQITKGALNIPNVGKILLIARPHDTQASLRLYLPPTGQVLFDSEWAKVAHKSAPVDTGGFSLSQAVAPVAPFAPPQMAAPQMAAPIPPSVGRTVHFFRR